MDTCSTSFLSDTCDRGFYFFFIPTHHEVGELIDDDDDHRNTIFTAYFRIILFEVTSIDSLEYSESPLHLSDSPLEGIECFIRMVDHGSEKMWYAIIDTEFDLFRIDHDHAKLGWSILIKKG